MSGNSAAFWLRRIPESWEIVPTRRVLHVSKEVPGPTRSSEFDRLSLTMGGVLPKNKDDDRGLQPESMDGYQLLRRNDLVFKLIDLANTATSRVGLSPSEGLVSPAYIVASPSERLVPKFAYYYFFDLYNQRVFNKLGGDGVRSAIGPKDLGAIPFPLPPLEEQRAIADYLDRETTRIDQLVAEHERLIALARERYVACVDLDVDSESPKWIPLRRVARVIDCAHVTAEVTEDSRFPVAGLNEVGGVEVNLETSRMTTSEYFDLLREGAREPRDGDLVFVRNVSVGRAAVVQSGLPKFALGQDCVLIRPENGIDSHYLRLALETSAVKAAIEVASKGSTFKRINVAQIRDIPLPLTSIQAQQRVVMKLMSRFDRFRELEAKKLAFVALLAERRAALITAAVTGRIDVSQGRAA